MSKTFSTETLRWMRLTIELYDKRQNGFGATLEVWNEVKGHGWYATERGWLSLTDKGRAEVPVILDRLN